MEALETSIAQEAQAFFYYLQPARRVVIFGHKGPDGDAIGSALALRLLLLAYQKQVSVIVSGSMPQNLQWLPGASDIWHEGTHDTLIDTAMEECDLVVCVDFNQLSRLGSTLAPRIAAVLQRRAEVPTLMVDHHLYPSDEFTWRCSHTEAAATCEVLTLLLKHGRERWAAQLPDTPEGAQMRAQMATCLLTGIITDTGLFNHASSRAGLFEAVALLLQEGAQKEEAVRRLYHNYNESRQRLQGYILYEKVVVLPEIKSAYFILTREDFERFRIGVAETDGFVNMPLDIKGVECSAFFRETVDEGIKVSLRSIGDIAVNELSAACFGGGGHKNAAGGEYYAGTIGQAVDLFVDYMRCHYYNPSKQAAPLPNGIPIPPELLQ